MGALNQQRLADLYKPRNAVAPLPGGTTPGAAGVPPPAGGQGNPPDFGAVPVMTPQTPVAPRPPAPVMTPQAPAAPAVPRKRPGWKGY